MTALSRAIGLALLFATTVAHAQTIPPWWYQVDPPTWTTPSGTNYDAQKTTLGTYPANAEFANGTANVPGAVVGEVAVPGGSAVTQVMGVSGYALTASSSVPAVGLYGAGLIANGAPTGEAEGSNVNVSNCGQPQCVAGTGQAFGHLIGFEADINAMSGPGGQIATGAVFGFLANGASDAAPGGAATGFEVWPLGSTGVSTQVPWRNAFQSLNGAAGIGLQLGSQTPGSGDYSQAILMHSHDAAGDDLQAQVQGTPLGELAVTPAAGQFVVNGWGLRITQAYAPTSSSMPCKTGQMQWDGNWIYVCIGPSSWKRASLQAF